MGWFGELQYVTVSVFYATLCFRVAFPIENGTPLICMGNKSKLIIENIFSTAVSYP